MPPYPPAKCRLGLLEFALEILDVPLAPGLTLGLVKILSPQLERGLYITQSPLRSLHLRLASRSERTLSLGRLWTDRGLLEAVHLRRFGSATHPWLLKLAGTVTRPPSSIARLRLFLGRRSERSSFAWSFASPGEIVGVSYLRKLGRTGLAVGGEIYYTEGENSGGRKIDRRSHRENAC